MYRSLSTPSYSGQPAKRSFLEAMITDCGWRGSLYGLFVLCVAEYTIFCTTCVPSVYGMDCMTCRSLINCLALLSLEYVFSQELKLVPRCIKFDNSIKNM